MKSNLEKFFLDKRTDLFLGRRACFKLAVLTALLSGEETLASVARRYGVTPQAAQKHANSARKIYGL